MPPGIYLRLVFQPVGTDALQLLSLWHELMSARSCIFSDIERPRPARLSSASLTRPDEYYFCWHSRLAARAAAAMSARLQELRRKKRIRDLKLAAEARYSSPHPLPRAPAALCVAVWRADRQRRGESERRATHPTTLPTPTPTPQAKAQAEAEFHAGDTFLAQSPDARDAPYPDSTEYGALPPPPPPPGSDSEDEPPPAANLAALRTRSGHERALREDAEATTRMEARAPSRS